MTFLIKYCDGHLHLNECTEFNTNHAFCVGLVCLYLQDLLCQLNEIADDIPVFFTFVSIVSDVCPFMIRCFLLGFEHLYTKQNLCFLRSADELLRNQETCDLLHFSGFLEHKLKERWLSCGSAGRPRERDGCKGQLDSQMSIWTRRFSYNTQLS